MGDTRVLLIQNSYYGGRDELLFDLIHKAGPIQFLHLPDNANQDVVAAESKRLRAVLVDALGLCLKDGLPGPSQALFQGRDHTTKRAYF